MKLIHLPALLSLVLCAAASAAVQTLDIDGAWTLRQQGKDEAIPATVPGVVHTDLLAAGRIPDPFDGKNEETLQWIGEAAWTYSRSFDVPADLLKRSHLLLRCEGLDTVASITLNGQKLGETDNMFRAYEFDVKPLLKAGENTIAITFSPIKPYIDAQISLAKKNLTGPATWFDGMPMVRKPVYSEGWDFGPRFFTAGIWKPIKLLAWDAARLTYVTVDQELHGDLASGKASGADLSITAHADVDSAAKNLTATATVSLDGKQVAHASGPVAGESTPMALKVDQPQLWFPAGLGEHPLYDIAVEVKDTRGVVVDRHAQRIGLRRVELLPKTDDRPLRLRVNGREIFAKGANWIPPDMFAPRATPEHVRNLLEQAAGANFNSMRVWGGGYYPGDDFFDAADELGLLIWMDFSYACKAYPVGNPTWAENVKQETVGVVRRLRHHPSMAVWCGNNEVEAIVKSYGVMGQADYDKLFHGLIGETVKAECPAAQYVGGSPEAGDEHNWWVWHIGADFEKYRESHGWMTEFGFQSFPEPATVDTYTTSADRDSVKSDVMMFHQNNKDGNENILGQMAKYFRPAKDFDSTLWLSQINQAYGMCIGVEHWRSDWPNSSGSYVWQYDDCWPGPTWACVDYFGRPKAVLYRLRHAYAPLMVTGVFDKESASVAVKLVSEFDRARKVAVSWKLTDLTGKTIKQGKATVAAKAGTSSVAVPKIDLTDSLKQAGGPASALLWLDAKADGASARHVVFLARPKELNLPDPGLSMDVKKAGDGFDVTLTAQRPALWAWLALDGDPDATLSDNFLHLAPAAPATIRLTPSKPMDAAAVKSALRARSLYDTYDHPAASAAVPTPAPQLAAATLAPTTAQAAVAATEKPMDLVNILQGTNSNIGYSHGGTLPLVGTPWPMTHWAAMSNCGSWENGDGWYFNPNDHALVGFRATHQPSPWMGDWGQFVLMPQTGNLVVGPDERKSPYDQKSAVFRPDYMKLDLTRYAVTGELTATSRCALLRLTYREGESGRLLIDPALGGHVEIDGRTVRGYTTYGAGRGAPQNFKSFFVIELDRDPAAVGTFDGSDVKRDAKDVTGKNVGAFVEFAVGDSRTVNIRVANSFISYEQAERNLKQEATGGFDAVRRRVADEWEKSLGRLTVKGGTEEQRRTFYSCLYRAQTFPHRLHEIDEAGKPVHFGFYNAKPQVPGVLYGDVGFWDVYRTNFSLWALVYPTQLGEILEGFNNAYREGGWYPQWPSPGPRGGMIGSHIDAVMADAIVKGIKGFDYDTAYAGIRKNAFGDATGKNDGRAGFEWYDKLGYVPAGKIGYSVSASLDYAYDDWCVAQVAKKLGKTEDYDVLMKRSQNYRKLFDPETGFFRARDEAGNFVEPFDPLAWGGAYVEGGPWQCSWAVQHDPDGLAELLGGKQAMLDRLDQMLGMPPAYHVGDYHGEIHEMTEMANIRFGQLSQGNQPVHHILYFFDELGQPWKTQYWTRRALQDLYDSGPDGFPGDEDNGEQASWYVLNAMGLYPFCVGRPDYDLSGPLFDELTLRRPGGKAFTITAKNNATFHPYVQSRTLDGEPFAAERISYDTIMNGGELTVYLASRPPADVKP